MTTPPSIPALFPIKGGFKTTAEAPICTIAPEDLLRHLGLTAKFSGFRAAIRLLERVTADPGELHLVTRRLYPSVAQELGITPAALERSVRTLVQVCWERGDRAYLDQLAGFHLSVRPSNTEFIDILSSYLRRHAQ